VVAVSSNRVGTWETDHRGGFSCRGGRADASERRAALSAGMIAGVGTGGNPIEGSDQSIEERLADFGGCGLDPRVDIGRRTGRDVFPVLKDERGVVGRPEFRLFLLGGKLWD
jgi:hypothetical protein